MSVIFWSQWTGYAPSFDAYKATVLLLNYTGINYAVVVVWIGLRIKPTLELYQAWNDDAEWDREQLIYSKMLCSQTDFVFHQVAINSFYFAYDFDAEHFKQYKLLHFHSAKGPKPVFALIKKYAEGLI